MQQKVSGNLLVYSLLFHEKDLALLVWRNAVSPGECVLGVWCLVWHVFSIVGLQSTFANRLRSRSQRLSSSILHVSNLTAVEGSQLKWWDEWWWRENLRGKGCINWLCKGFSISAQSDAGFGGRKKYRTPTRNGVPCRNWGGLSNICQLPCSWGIQLSSTLSVHMLWDVT